MPQPLRKSLQKTAAAADKKPRRFTVSLSGVAVAALGVALVAAVGWAFFMGFMVGRGQNPEKRVEQMTGMAREERAPRATADLPAGPAARNPAGQPEQPIAGTAPDAEQAVGPAPAALSAQATQAAQSAQTPQAAPPNTPTYPFIRPQGTGLAAWGIRSDTAAGTPAPGTAPAAQPKARQKAPQAEALFDFAYQVAAFKDRADADKLRARLEDKGLRTNQQKSGKVLLVLVNLRGTELDAANLREELQRMKLGKPVLASKKAVSGKPRKTGR
ncbi:SPOR domain-containing protein [uncultured Desulfovibrio sp.]|uniref:SPOR domain-containing protein n=1 Tax=uncultured Desulfovibrio sp. TaxID=167968 RepID=UPI0003A084EA|nr:SPOR domain-containing protein [uncultured Desulfovibrio sp.]